MPKLIGIAAHSMLTFKQNLDQLGAEFTIINYNIKKLRSKKFIRQVENSPIVMVDSVKALNSAAFILNKTRSVVAVFDNPINLTTQPNIRIIDLSSVPTDYLGFKLQPLPINYTDIIKQTKTPQLTNNIIKTNPDVLGDIIKSFSTTGLLEKFNTCLYMVSKNNRNSVKALLVKFIFAKISGDELQKQLVNYRVPGKALDLIQKIIAYMQNEQGLRLRDALIEAKKMETTASSDFHRIAYKKLAEKHNVDKFELRNLMLLSKK